MNLFSAIEDNPRTLRQKEAIQKWVDNRLKGIIVGATGIGKTKIGLMAVDRFLSKNPTKKVLIIVPSDPIKTQWVQETISWNIFDSCEVHTMHDVSKNEYSCDLLIVDEIHKCLSNTLIKLFDNIKYKAILGLTATLERLDGRHVFLRDKCPVVDTIPITEAVSNNWLAEHKQYLVLIEPEDISTYLDYNREFYEHFSYFNHDFSLAMNCAQDYKVRAKLASQRCNGDNFKDVNKQVLIHAMGFNRALQARKKYINSHPKKIELAELILEHRMDKKCITFSNTIAMAEKIKYGKAYSGKDTVKKGRMTLSEFMEMDSGVLNTINKVNEGFNCPDLSVAIILGLNSSKTVNTQRVGRVIRFQEGKTSEIFYLVLKGTVEETWFKNAIGNSEYVTINEENLLSVLKGEEFNTKKNKETSMIFRF